MTLSDKKKLKWNIKSKYSFEEEDLKKAIKKLKEEIRDDKKILRLQVPFIWDKIDKIFGEELSK